MEAELKFHLSVCFIGMLIFYFNAYQLFCILLRVCFDYQLILQI